MSKTISIHQQANALEQVQSGETPLLWPHAQWNELIAAMHSGRVIEVEAETYNYFLEVLPPVYIGRKIKLPSGERVVDFGFAEGCEPITAFWSTGGRFYCQRTAEVNLNA